MNNRVGVGAARRRRSTRPTPGKRLQTVLAAIFALGAPVAGATAVAADLTQVSPVTVIGASPLPGAHLDIAKAPYDVQTLTDGDLRRSGAVTAGGALEARLGSVSLNDNLDSPFQPDILYRGFEASPVLGTPQGLAVYQNGVRINEAFGDGVNWDLIPDPAIARIDVVGANPVYGLNALGGAVVVTMKTGFDDPGREVEAEVGAFGRRSASLTLAGHGDRLGGLLVVKGLDEDGWRDRSGSRLRQLYGALGWRTDRLSLDLSYSGADNLLRGEGATPVQALAVSRKLIFTSPQLNANRLGFLTLNGTYAATPTLSLQGAVYLRDVRQSVVNGNTTGFTACAAPGAGLCQADAATRLGDTVGGAVPDLSQSGAVPLGETDRETLRAFGLGATLQASSTAALLGRPNQATAGATLDASQVDFASSIEVGVIDPAGVVQPSGYLIATPEGTPFSATPVRLRSAGSAAGLYLTDTWDVTERLSVTASGRYNRVRIALRDRLGAALDGTSVYQRVNPALGLAYRLRPGFSAYLGYAEGSRAPTASEIECSDPSRPCLLPSSLSADPPTLKQVVSRTVETGLRGGTDLAGGRLTYAAGLYRTEVRDDIYGVATSLSAGYFTNIAGTLRQGGDVSLSFRSKRITAYASYAHLDATFDTALRLPSPSNPLRDASGTIPVRRGDRLPGVPGNRFKAGFDAAVTSRLRIGADLKAVDSQAYRGDEAHLLKPLPGYAVIGLHGSWRGSPGVELFGRVENALDARYATFGLLGDPTGARAPGVPMAPGAVDPRFVSPAAPLAVYAGVRAAF